MGLHSADKHVTPLFRDYRWNSVRSTVPSSLWLSVLRQYQLDSRVAADNLLSLFRAPIWNLFASDASPEMSRDTLLGLILWLALSLWTAGAGNANVEMVDIGPLILAQVCIGLDLMMFQFRDPTAGTQVYALSSQ